LRFYANLKCNHTRKSFSEYAEILDDSLDGSYEVVVFPPASAFSQKAHKFRQGAQNFYPVENGNFTGEIGLSMLDEFSIKDVLIGHSERRALSESDEFIKAKFEFAKKHSLNAVLCIGESLEIKEAGKTKEFLKSQLIGVDLEYKNLVIAYEPVWAIGTGKSASVRDIAEILEFLASLTKAPLLYGGSVNEKNIKEIASVKNCNGVLVGTASFEAESFLNLIRR